MQLPRTEAARDGQRFLERVEAMRHLRRDGQPGAGHVVLARHPMRAFGRQQRRSAPSGTVYFARPVQLLDRGTGVPTRR